MIAFGRKRQLSFSGADAQIGNADYLFIRSPVTGVAEVLSPGPIVRASAMYLDPDAQLDNCSSLPVAAAGRLFTLSGELAVCYFCAQLGNV